MNQLHELATKYANGGEVTHPAARGLPNPNLLNLSMYADTVSRDMFPSRKDNVKRDAARHMLASAIAAQKTTPGIAEVLGKMHEFSDAPFRTAGHWLGVSEPRSDYQTDTHNNALGIELASKAKSMDELLALVQKYAATGASDIQPGRASLKPDEVKPYAEGGSVAAEPLPYNADRINALAQQLIGSD